MASTPKSAAELLALGEGVLGLHDLLDLAQEGTAASRNRLAESLGELYFDPAAGAGANERALMTEILRQLLLDVEVSVRKHLAEQFGPAPDAPASLLVDLAHDHAEVARAVLQNSPVLTDEDLMRVIELRTMQHRGAIALRPQVSMPVSDALVVRDEPSVITSLIANRGAQFSRETLFALVEASKEIEGYQAPLLHRPDLTSGLARQMYWWVSATLRKEIAANFEIGSDAFDKQLVDAVRDMMGEQAARALPVDGLDVLAQRLAARGEITSEILIQSLRHQQASLFEALFAQLLTLPKPMIERFIFEDGGESLAIACRAADILKHDFTTMFLLGRSARPGEKVVDPGELARAVAFYDRIAPETARKVVSRWRDDPNYLDTLRQQNAADRGL